MAGPIAGTALSLLVAAELARQALGPDALLLIDNVLRHEAPAPRAAPAMVRELLARPLDATDAASLFRRTVPEALHDLRRTETPLDFDRLLERYLGELQAARKALPRVGRVPAGMPSDDELLSVTGRYDATAFFEATLRFAHALRNVALPQGARFFSEIGTIVVGTPENDAHGPGAAIIIDPGGDDTYERAPATRGAVSVIVDFGGDDRYAGSDIAAGGLSALIDFSGNDRFEMSGPGLGAALGGGSLLVDFSGNDRYAALNFAQGAAAFGMGVLIDVEGDDEYVLGAWGQGLGLAEGVGLLWDRAGNDRYAASGVPDPHGRGSILSGAQGAAFGFRTALGGGVGILREERGDDRYEAHMFAQGSGYYYGAGLLWDEQGNDRYSAVRYAQGNGAHQALGVLRDESGADSYTLSYGVGQGMGLDLAVGALVDAAGDDRYDGGVLAQGTATANGLGLLHDAGGTDALRATGRFAWGEAQPLRGLPSVGLLLVANAVFERIESTAAGSAKPRPCGEPDPAVNREDFDALLTAGNALRCRLERGERWSEAEALLVRDPADPLAAWIAPALPAAPAELREKLREILWRHPRCSVKALSLSDDNLEEALRSDCWMLQAAALRAGAQPGPEVKLPGFLRSRRAY